jgi:hypothetical protein
MALESSITSRALKWLNAQPQTIAEKVFGCAQQRGRPDINGCCRGHSFRIEMKSPDHDNQPSDLQIQNLLDWSKAGSTTGVAYSLEDVKKIFEKIPK